MKQANFIELNFYGTANGSNLTLVEPLAQIQGKSLRIINIIKRFYANTNVVIEAFASSMSPLTFNQYKVVKNKGLIPKNSLGWYYQDTVDKQYFQLIINENILFNQDNTKVYNGAIEDVHNLDLVTDIIETFNVIIKVDHFVDYVNSTSKFYPYVSIKILAEIMR